MKRILGIVFALSLGILTGCGEEEKEPVDACTEEPMDDSLALDDADDGESEANRDCGGHHQQFAEQPRNQHQPPMQQNHKIDDEHEPDTHAVAEPADQVFLSLTYQDFPEQNIHPDSDEGLRRVGLNHNADKLECSYDGGMNFEDCDSMGEMIWDASDYNTPHHIKAFKDGAPNSPVEMSFVPSSQYPDQTFLACDQVVSVSEDFDAFRARILADTVVCLKDGVTVFNNDTLNQSNLTVDVSNFTIIAEADAEAMFLDERTSHSQTIATNSSGNGLKLYNLKVENRSGGIASAAVSLSFGDNHEVKYMSIENNGDGEGLKIWNSENTVVSDIAAYAKEREAISVGGDTSGTSISHFSAHADDDSAFELHNGGTVSLSYGYLDSPGDTLSLASGGSGAYSFQGDYLTIVNRDTGNYQRAVAVGLTDGGGTGSLTNSKIYVFEAATQFGGAMYVYGSAGHFTIENNVFVRMNMEDNSSWAIRITSSGGVTDLLRSTQNNNLFCNQDSAGKTFSTILDVSTGDAQTTFDPSLQSGGTINNCPSEIDYPELY